MPQFDYKARQVDGGLVRGRVEADTEMAAARQISQGGNVPLEISVHNERHNPFDGLRRRLGLGRPGRADILLFTRQMYALTKAGLPIIQGLTRLASSTPNRVLGEIILEVIDDLESGRDLAGALARHPRTFSTLYINMVHVGEESGRLEEAFWRLFQYLEREKTTIDRVKAALRYPTLVLVAVAVAIGVLTVMVIPAFAKVFSSFDMDLPWATRAILSISEFMAAWWPAVLAVLFAGFIGAKFWVRTHRGRLTWDRYKLHLPIVGGIVYRATLARFARSFAMTTRSGVPVTQGLLAVSRAIDNLYLSGKVRGMNTGIQRGEDLTRVATASGMFSPLVLQMLAMGEETGQIEDMMEEAAEFDEREVDYDIDRLGDLIQPVVTVILGVMVLVLALGVFLPMWELTSIAGR